MPTIRICDVDNNDNDNDLDKVMIVMINYKLNSQMKEFLVNQLLIN